MKQFLMRLLTFAIFIPLLFLFFFKWYFFNSLPLNLAIIVFSFLGTREMVRMFRKDHVELSPWGLLAFLGASFSIVAYITLWFPSLDWINELWFVVVILFIFIYCVFLKSNDDFSNLLPMVSRMIILMTFPGYLFAFIIRFQAFPEPNLLAFLFVLMVFANDIFAYLGGVLLGKNNKLNLKISPNKSLAGFLTGYIVSIAIPLGCYFVHPSLVGNNLIFALLLGGVLGIFTILGDLIESAFKRAVNVKDSGRLMLGRGGVMDSIDSLIVTAPVFYLMYKILFGI